MIVAAAAMCNMGLDAVEIIPDGMIAARKEHLFNKHYGSSPKTLADIWNTLILTEILAAKVSKGEKLAKGIKQFLLAHYWLWTYPKNAAITASHLHLGEKSCRGKELWKWIFRIAALKELKVVWTDSLNNPSTSIFIVTVDGTDFRTWEPKHPLFPVDCSYCSHKYKHAALLYEIAISIFTGQVVWVSDPYPAGTHDMTIFQTALKSKIAPGKKVIADRGYKSSEKDEKMMATPNPYDSKEVANFKSRARCQQESFNGRLKKFAALSDTYRHSLVNHRHVLEAVVVIVQFQMDNGAQLFDV